MNENDYRKLTDKNIREKDHYARTTTAIGNAYGEIPKGSIVKITRKYNGFDIISITCACCGGTLKSTRVPYVCLDLVDYDPEDYDPGEVKMTGEAKELVAKIKTLYYGQVDTFDQSYLDFVLDDQTAFNYIAEYIEEKVIRFATEINTARIGTVGEAREIYRIWEKSGPVNLEER